MAGGLLYDLSLKLSANVADFRKNVALTSTDLKSLQTSSKNTQKGMKGMVDSASQSLGGLKAITNNVVGSMGSSFGDMGGMFSGMLGMVKSIIPVMHGLKAAFISTGIGAIIIAITLAVAGLVSWFKRTDEGGAKLKEMFGGIKAVVEVLGKRLAYIGEAVAHLFKGEFKEAKEAAGKVFEPIKDDIKEAFVAGKALANMQTDLAKKMERYNLTRKTLESEIEELKTKAVDTENYSATQRLKFIQLAKQKVKELAEYDISIAEAKVAIQKEEIRLGVDTIATRTKLYDIEAEAFTAKKEAATKMKEILGTEKALVVEAQKEADLIKKANEYRAMAIPLKLEIQPVKSPSVAPKIDKTGLADMKEFAKPPSLSYWEEYTVGYSTLWETAHKQTLSGFIEMSRQAIHMGAVLTSALEPAVGALTDAFAGLFTDSEAGFKDVVTVALQAIGQIINALFAQAIAGVIAGESKKGLVGLALGAIGVGVLTALWKAKVPSFAEGGVVSKPTLAMIGDAGPGNPEYVLPQKKLENMLGGAGGGQVKFIIEQNALVGILEGYNKKQLYF